MKLPEVTAMLPIRLVPPWIEPPDTVTALLSVPVMLTELPAPRTSVPPPMDPEPTFTPVPTTLTLPVKPEALLSEPPAN